MPVAAIAPPAYRMQGAPGVVPPSGAAMLAASNFRSAPTLVFDSGGADAGQSALADPATAGAHSNGNDDFAARLGAAGGTSATARASFDPRTTIAQGTLIPAVLETGLDTDVPGYVRAIISEDVRSFDGSRVLVPRSSRLIGQYRSGMQAGQKRAYVIWTRIIRSDGVSVNIGSPGVDFSGQSGLAGKVDTHFFERFGSGILLSVIGGLSTLGGTTTVIIGGAGQSAAAEAVGQSAQISPTVRVHQGEPIRVFTARDLDFSKVPGS
jgi:type IV secretion system protein VirB10